MIIVTSSTTAIRAAHDAAPNVPIVSWAAAHPVIMGWAQTLAKPGGMITGVFQVGSNAKRFELLKEVRPQATTFGYLMNATNPANRQFKVEAGDAAQTLGTKLERLLNALAYIGSRLWVKTCILLLWGACLLSQKIILLWHMWTKY
jgi:putative ABC transport system substrate-binding protein